MPESSGFRSRAVQVIHVLFVTVALLHLALVCAQPVLAGWSLDGVGTAIDLHAANAGIVLTLSMLLVPLAVLWWRPGRRSIWAPTLAVALFFAESFQHQAGYAGIFVVHLPLGVAIVIESVTLVAMALRRRSSSPRRPQPTAT